MRARLHASEHLLVRTTARVRAYAHNHERTCMREDANTPILRSNVRISGRTFKVRKTFIVKKRDIRKMRSHLQNNDINHNIDNNDYNNNFKEILRNLILPYAARPLGYSRPNRPRKFLGLKAQPSFHRNVHVSTWLTPGLTGIESTGLSRPDFRIK